MVDWAILGYECRRQWTAGKLVVAYALQAAGLGGIFVWMMAARMGRVLDAILFSQMWLVLLVPPILAVLVRKPTHAETPTRVLKIALSKWAGGSIAAVSFCVLAWLVCVLIFGLSNVRLLTALLKVLLLFCVLLAFSMSLGLLWALICKYANHAIFASYAALGLLITDVFWVPPLVPNHLGTWIPAILLLNPFVALSAIRRLDLFRTPYLYEVSLITSYSYVYPAWYVTALLYLAMALLCMALIGWRLALYERRR